MVKKTASKNKKPAKRVKKFLSRETILKAKDVAEEDVHVPEWAGEDDDPEDCYVKVVAMDGNRRDAYQNMVEKARKQTDIDMAGLTTKFVIAVVLDPKTLEPLFNESDLAVLQKRSAKPMDRIMLAGQRISGMAQESIKELIENLGLTPKEDTGLSSPKS